MPVTGVQTCALPIYEVTVVTRVGREEHGTLIEVNPHYELNYGDYVPEITAIEDQLRTALFGGNKQ